MIAYANWVAKAIVAGAIPWATLGVDIAAGWLDVAEDGVVGLSGWQGFGLSVVLAFSVFLKGNGEQPE